MVFERAVTSDIGKIMPVVESARGFLNDSGVDQWQRGYPSEKSVAKDISDGNGYVARDGDDILAYFVWFVGEDPTYAEIFHGEWKYSGDYGVAHCVCVAKQGLGLGKQIIKTAKEWTKLEGADIFRIDTHRDNLVMQRLLQGSGLCYAGIINSNDGERLAYEMLI